MVVNQRVEKRYREIERCGRGKNLLGIRLRLQRQCTDRCSPLGNLGEAVGVASARERLRDRHEAITPDEVGCVYRLGRRKWCNLSHPRLEGCQHLGSTASCDAESVSPPTTNHQMLMSEKALEADTSAVSNSSPICTVT